MHFASVLGEKGKEERKGEKGRERERREKIKE